MNISGRIISSQGFPSPEHSRVELSELPGKQNKTYATHIQTAAGRQEVLDLNRASGRTALKHALRENVKPDGKDIFLRVSQHQVLKLHINQATTRRSLLRDIAVALNQPAYDIDIKFKAGLARVYQTLTTKSSAANQERYLQNAPVEHLDQKLADLTAELNRRIPGGQANSLKQAMSAYPSSSEDLESISAQAYARRHVLNDRFRQGIQSAIQTNLRFYQSHPADFFKNYNYQILLEPKQLHHIEQNHDGFRDKLQQNIILIREKQYIQENILYYKDNPEGFAKKYLPKVKITPELLKQIQSNQDGIQQSILSRYFAQRFIPYQKKFKEDNFLIQEAMQTGALGTPFLTYLNMSQQLRNDAFHQHFQKVLESASSEIYSAFNHSETVQALPHTYGGQENVANAQKAYIKHLQAIASDRPKGDSDLQTSKVKLHALDLEADLASPKSDFFRFKRDRADPNLMNHRIYLNIKPEFGPALLRHLVALMDNQGDEPGIETIKIAGPALAGTRSDSMMIYTHSKEASQRVIDLITAIQDTGLAGAHGIPDIPPHSEMFGDDTPRTAQRIRPGIATGDEPGGGHSFAGLRSDTLMKTVLETHHQDLSFAQFHAQVEQNFKKALIDPDRADRRLPRQ